MISFFSFAFLIASLLMVAVRIITRNITLLVIQSLALSLIAFYLGFFSAGVVNWHMVIVGGITLVVKVIVLPWVLYRMAKKIVVPREVPSSIGSGPSLIIGVLLVGLTYSYVVPIMMKGIQPGGQLLSVALSTILLGCFFMISRRSAFNQVMGIIVIENGLFLCGVAVTGGMPLIIELGIFFDLFVGVLVMGMFTYQIRDTFDTLDTKVLNKLKG